MTEGYRERVTKEVFIHESLKDIPFLSSFPDINSIQKSVKGLERLTKEVRYLRLAYSTA